MTTPHPLRPEVPADLAHFIAAICTLIERTKRNRAARAGLWRHLQMNALVEERTA